MLPISITTTVMSSAYVRVFLFSGHGSTSSNKRSANYSPPTIGLSAKADHFKVGLPIPVGMTITNTGEAPLTLEVITARHSEYYGYRFALTFDGNNVPKTSFHKVLIHEDGATDPKVPYDASSPQQQRARNIEPASTTHCE